MERESFESEAVAAVMNELFVCVKVDREERPDVDQTYMTAVQLLTRRGGWPMSVWLTPDLRPFYGGTYFPAHDHGDRPGFVSLLRGLADAYRNRRPDVDASAEDVTRALRQLAEPPAADVAADGRRRLRRAADRAVDVRLRPPPRRLRGGPQVPPADAARTAADVQPHAPRATGG